MVATETIPLVGARIEMDPRNRRIRLVDCGRDAAETVRVLEALADAQGIDKVWGFVSPTAWQGLRERGFRQEGVLDGYLPDSPGVAVARYFSAERARTAHTVVEDAIVHQAQCAASKPTRPAPAGYALRVATRSDCEAISALLTSVFDTYPSPIESGAAIAAAMDKDVHYVLAEYAGRLVSVCSADVDREHAVAEMTDCATLPEHRGRGLMQALLGTLEGEMGAIGLRSLFTLARAPSPSINKAFARLGYQYRGRFINNCHIAGNWEDMNIWVKLLD